MKKILRRVSFVLLYLLPLVLRAQTTTIVDVRTGVREGHFSYKLVEFSQVRDRLILPHVGYLDFAHFPEYREFFIGGGYKLVETEKLEISTELYYLQTAGKLSEHAWFLQPAAEAEYAFTPKLRAKAAAFVYAPMTEVGRKQFVLERAKLEYALIEKFKAGAGYGAYQAEGDEWKESLFASVTVTPFHERYGSMEFWYQTRVRQLQLRYKLCRGGKKEHQ